MIAESSFAAVFGAPVPGGEDSLVHLARAAVRAGFAIVPCYPGSKQPLCTLPSRDVKRADAAAQEEARLAGSPRWQAKRHACGVKHAITTEKDSDRIIRRLVRDYGAINLGVELGLSRVILVDVDTVVENEAFARSWAEATGEPLPFGMTVRSPGVYDRTAEEWKHKDGGHYWFTLPEGFALPAEDGAMKDSSGWVAMWANRQALVPPSVRDEGPYLLVGDPHPAPAWLLERVVDYIAGRRRRAADQRANRGTRVEGREPHIDAWSASTSWEVLLEPDGWYDTGLPDNCGCSIWTAPGVHASPKSATAHDVGCDLYDDSPGHAPLHVWTDNPPEFLLTGGKTFTKIQYVALRDHGGDIQLACRAEGIDREIAPLVPLPGVPAALAGPIAANGDTWYYDQGGAEETATFMAQTPSLVGSGPPNEMGQTEQFPVQGISATPEYETWAAGARPDELGPEDLEGLGYERPRLVGIPAPPPDAGVVPPFPEGAAPAAAPPSSPAATAAEPPLDPILENLVRADLQRLWVRAEAEKRWTEIRYPYAARTAARGFQSMREVIKAADEAPATFLVEDWIRSGSYGVLGAEYKAGKTFFVIDMALSIVTGGMFLGMVPCQLGRVAMMHNEGDRNEFVDRLRAVAEFKRITLTDEVMDRLHFQEGATRMDRPEEIARLYENLEGFAPDLLTLDPWYMSAGDEADGKTLSKMGTVLGNLQGVAAEVGCALLVTTHWNQTGSGKGVSRWSGAGLAEWGRFLINVAVDKYRPARPYADDPTRRTTADLAVSLSGQVSGTYTVHREVWRDDAKDLATPLRYIVAARETEDPASATITPSADVTRTERERLLHAFAAVPTGLTKTKAISTAKGSRAGGSSLTTGPWAEAFDELRNEGLIEDVGEVDRTTTTGQVKAAAEGQGTVKFAITQKGTAEIGRLDGARTRGGSVARFVGAGLAPPTTQETED